MQSVKFCTPHPWEILVTWLSGRLVMLLSQARASPAYSRSSLALIAYFFFISDKIGGGKRRKSPHYWEKIVISQCKLNEFSIFSLKFGREKKWQCHGTSDIHF